MKISIPVRADYTLPSLYTEPNSEELIEIALSLGAISVEMVRSVPNLFGTDSSSVDPSPTVSREIVAKLEADLQRLREENLQIKRNAEETRSRQYKELEDLRSRMIADSLTNGERIAKEEVEMARRAMKVKFSVELDEALELERRRIRTHFEAEIKAIEDRHRKELENKLANSERIFEELKLERREQLSKILENSTKVLTFVNPACTVKTSSDLGRQFEDNIAKYIRQVYGTKPGFKLDDVHSQSHAGDLLLEYDGVKVMIELKNYSVKVPKKEVDKLIRDLSESDPPCHAAVMISSNTEITGHYTCGNFEICNIIPKTPILFVNNFNSLGDPLISLHMIRVFLDMISHVNKACAVEESIDNEKVERQKTECIRRCSEFIADLDKQTAEILKQVNLLSSTAASLKKSVSTLVETEINRFESIKRLLHFSSDKSSLNSSVFRPPHALTEDTLALAHMISEDFIVSDNEENTCTIKELISYINLKTGFSDKRCRELIKAMFLDQHVQHRGHVSGIKKKL